MRQIHVWYSSMRKYGVLWVGSPKILFSYLSTHRYSSSVGSSRGVRLQGHIINTISEEEQIRCSKKEIINTQNYLSIEEKTKQM